jgi:hypothetical protein
VEASLTGYRRLRSWAKAWPRRRWAIENAHGLGRHLAQWLLARQEGVVDVPTTATRRVRELSRGGRRTNDVIDAAAAASVAALYDDATPVTVEDTSTVLALLDERRTNLSQQRVRAVNQLHALLRELLRRRTHQPHRRPGRPDAACRSSGRPHRADPRTAGRALDHRNPSDRRQAQRRRADDRDRDRDG